MKILHFADLHLGVENYGHIDPSSGLSSRLIDFLSALDQVVDYALENQVDLVLFCGDAYKTREPSQTQQREFARRIKRLSAGGIPVFLLVGNHDLPNTTGRATSTEIFATLAVENVYVSGRPDLYRIPTRGGTLQIVSLPWLRRSALLAREETRNLSFEEINRKLEEVLSATISYNSGKLDPELPAVLAAHIWVANARLGSEKGMTIGQEHTLLLSNLTGTAFDYVALGHIHRHQVLSVNPPVIYAGSLERLDFGEEEEDKGFCVVDIKTATGGTARQADFEFHRVSGRRFVTIDVAIDSQDGDPTKTVLTAIRKQEERIKGAVVRLQIKLPVTVENLIRDGDIREELRDASYFTIVRDIERAVRLRLGSGRTAEEITPLEALKAYLETKKVSPSRMKLLLEHGEKLIQKSRG